MILVGKHNFQDDTDQPNGSNNDSCRKKGEVRVLGSNDDHIPATKYNS